ncbi:putative E3 ubiquitin-protein ligase ARI4 [Fusarium oxysporum f. sp. rapae]|uniref:RBR-type E3 ubiquitin transferase n=1 Tax=Fusarium oxysporum f. sp. rapae TaxID=485398 RepID=A0A8J5PCA7_FUSOX|nr:putative E3 ubiquitin-protein ligase ARI4 [Fusarium oxysporum f. sp. rapae]
MSDVSDALDRVHPDFLDLLIRHELLPPEGDDGFSEPYLARLISIALELAEDDEQAFLVGRIITEEELAFERLRSPEVRNINHRVVLDRTERRIAFREAANDPAPEQGNGEDCLICTEDAHLRAPCGHSFCLECFRETIRRGLRSQEVFPPRCCQLFNEEAIQLAHAPALVHIFRQMKEEADVPIHDRLYCHDGNCAAFIPPDRNGHCLLCDTHTCRDCGERGHPGQPCREGAAEEDVWATMDENRTVNCPRCGRMIELAEACNHMTCPCGQEFCFICGRVWHNCNCPVYGGFHLMVPMRDRPGRKPEQYRRRPHPNEGAAADRADGALRIPQLRPMQGEEERVPPRVGGPRRVIRPLVLPPPEEQQEPQEQRRHGEHHGRERQHGERHHHGERNHHGERRHHDERNQDAYERDRNRRRAERQAGMPMEPRRVEHTMVGRPPDAPRLRRVSGNMVHAGDVRIANQTDNIQGGYAPKMRMDCRRDDGRAAMEALMLGMGRMQINEQRIERPPARDDRRPYRPIRNEMDAPQIDRARRETAYDAMDAEARRRNQNRLLAMNREAARLAAQDPPRQQGRNRQGHYRDDVYGEILIDSDDDLYGDD